MGEKLLRLKQVLEIIPVSESTWYRGIKAGYYPKPIKVGLRANAWKLSDINELIEKGYNPDPES